MSKGLRFENYSEKSINVTQSGLVNLHYSLTAKLQNLFCLVFLSKGIIDSVSAGINAYAAMSEYSNSPPFKEISLVTL